MNGKKMLAGKFTYVKKASLPKSITNNDEDKKPVVIDEITIKDIYIEYLPNGLATSATINWKVHVAKGSPAGEFSLTESLKTSYATYAAREDCNFERTDTHSVTSDDSTIMGTTKVYCVLYGGGSSSGDYTTYTLKYGDKQVSSTLRFKAGSFTPGGYFYTD